MIHSIETIPFLTFSKIAKTNDKTLLLSYCPKNKFLRRVYFRVFKINLDTTWDKIRSDYLKHEDSEKSSKVEQLKKDLIRAKSHYYAVISCLEILKYGKDDKVIENLKSLKIYIKGEYWNGLAIAFKQVNNIESKIKGIENEINGYLKATSTLKEVSTYDILANLTVGLNLSFRLNDILTLEYISFKKQLLEKNKQ